jgi:hypothetical protein
VAQSRPESYNGKANDDPEKLLSREITDGAMLADGLGPNCEKDCGRRMVLMTFGSIVEH